MELEEEIKGIEKRRESDVGRDKEEKKNDIWMAYYQNSTSIKNWPYSRIFLCSKYAIVFHPQTVHFLD